MGGGPSEVAALLKAKEKENGTMKVFRGKVAVITGAASGIGRGLADRCVQEGMKVVLADIDGEALIQAEKELKAAGATVLAVLTDVAKPNDIEALAQRTIDAFGAVHLLCNNAGVAAGERILEASLADWEWVIGVNLWGVIHGVRVFMPIMLEQDTDCHVVNTASMAGFESDPGKGIYKVTKHGIVSLSETLYHELVQEGARVGVSVLCPAWVNTRIFESLLERRQRLETHPAEDISPEAEEMIQAKRRALQEGMPPVQVADYVFSAIREGKFYIFTHQEGKNGIRRRMEDILQERNPTIA